jgi:hypothetical protein
MERRGRLIFALDATMSRQPTWDQACKLQAEMFREAAAVGGLDIQLVYYRGLGECRASSWVADPDRLGALMLGIDCRGGHTQFAKVLAHARRETESGKIVILVFVGDAMEESLDELCVPPESLACTTSRRLCSRRVTIQSANKRCAKLPASPAERSAASRLALPTNSLSFCVPRKPPAGSRLWPISKGRAPVLQD